VVLDTPLFSLWRLQRSSIEHYNAQSPFYFVKLGGNNFSNPSFIRFSDAMQKLKLIVFADV
jgi:hypothetical protein